MRHDRESGTVEEREGEGMETFNREEIVFMAASFGAVVALSLVSGLITLKVI